MQIVAHIEERLYKKPARLEGGRRSIYVCHLNHEKSAWRCICACLISVVGTWDRDTSGSDPLLPEIA